MSTKKLFSSIIFISLLLKVLSCEFPDTPKSSSSTPFGLWYMVNFDDYTDYKTSDNVSTVLLKKVNQIYKVKRFDVMRRALVCEIIYVKRNKNTSCYDFVFSKALTTPVANSKGFQSFLFPGTVFNPDKYKINKNKIELPCITGKFKPCTDLPNRLVVKNRENTKKSTIKLLGHDYVFNPNEFFCFIYGKGKHCPKGILFPLEGNEVDDLRNGSLLYKPTKKIIKYVRYNDKTDIYSICSTDRPMPTP